MTPSLPPAKLAEVTRAIGQLSTLKVVELKARLAALRGRPVVTNNRTYLIRKLAWHLRDEAEGHPMPRSLQELLEAGPALLPERWRERLSLAHAPAAPKTSTLPTPPAANPDRDPRLPVAGTELTRVFKGATHCIVVHEADFEYRGQRYRSLSGIAKVITGSPWNGLAFFGLGPRTVAARGAA